MACKHTRPWKLSESEDFPSFQSWLNAAEYYFTHGDNAVYKPYFTLQWTAKTAADPTRGLLPTDTLTSNDRVKELENLLHLIVQYCPHYLSSEIINSSTSITNVWDIVRGYYGFESSELTFMSLHTIHLEDGERPQRLYHRLLSHVRDNLLRKDTSLLHNGTYPTTNEELSPTLERVIVLRWLELLHPNLPAMVMKNFSYDLTCMTLKDLQPRICKTLPTMLEELKQEPTHGAINAVFSNKKFAQPRKFTPRPKNQVQCKLCLAEGRPANHMLANCDYISKAEKRQMYRTVQNPNIIRQLHDVALEDVPDTSEDPDPALDKE